MAGGWLENVSELLDGMQLFLTKSGEGGGMGRILQCINEVNGSFCSSISGRGVWEGTVMREEFNGVDAFWGAFGDIDMVAVVAFGGSAKVPAINTMWGPGVSVGGRLVNKHFGVGRGQWRAVEIEGTI